MKKVLRYLTSFLILFTAVGVYITNRIMLIKTKEEKDILKRDEDAGFLNSSEFHHLPQKEVSIASPFGYSLKAIVIAPWETNQYIIFCHGVTETKMSSVKYMNLFVKRGFNAVIYDQRRHGGSGGSSTSYGYYEKYDLKAVVDWLKNEKGPELSFGIHGESMGAATMLQYAGMLEDSADFYIADCPYSDFSEQLAYRVKEEVRLPPRLILPVARLFLKIRDRYSLKDVSPISAIEKIKNPVLFIHSQKDDYILPDMTKELYERKQGPKQLYLAKNGMHARSLMENHKEYEKAIDQFLNEYTSNTKA